MHPSILIHLEYLWGVDSVEGPDVLVVVEGGDDGDDVGLQDVLRHHAQHGRALLQTRDGQWIFRLQVQFSFQE